MITSNRLFSLFTCRLRMKSIVAASPPSRQCDDNARYSLRMVVNCCRKRSNQTLFARRIENTIQFLFTLNRLTYDHRIRCVIILEHDVERNVSSHCLN